MKSIEEIYQIVEESSHETAYNREECEALYDCLLKLPDGARVVEVGVQFGRSATVIAEVSKVRGFEFTAVDNWLEEYSTRAKPHFEGQIEKHGWNVKKLWMDSNMASKIYDGKIDLIHIDGDHEYEGVLSDIKHWLPKVNKGGYACFDDFGHDSLPGIWKACNEYFTEHKNWEFVGRFGNKLGVYKKL
jgi:predicted O-methyltransferase YrrM